MVMEYSDSLVHCRDPNVQGITFDIPPIDTSILRLGSPLAEFFLSRTPNSALLPTNTCPLVSGPC